MTWVKVSTTREIPSGTMMHVVVEEEDITVYHTEDGYYATSDICTHASESLSTGSLDGNVVACPRHGGKFDVKTGAAVAFPCVYALETYPVELRGEEIWLNY
jgi:nitrite reductase/ring-hydroxylating ferredoxin subunit